MLTLDPLFATGTAADAASPHGPTARHVTQAPPTRPVASGLAPGAFAHGPLPQCHRPCRLGE